MTERRQLAVPSARAANRPCAATRDILEKDALDRRLRAEAQDLSGDGSIRREQRTANSMQAVGGAR